MTANQPGLIDEGGYQRLSEARIEKGVNCYENHAESCSCRWDDVVTLPEVVIEDHETWVLVAEVAP